MLNELVLGGVNTNGYQWIHVSHQATRCAFEIVFTDFCTYYAGISKKSDFMKINLRGMLTCGCMNSMR
jgi:acyl-[acyl carrier protein]--UDP-N-acetylglucosamine O-acyltransferase